MKINYRTTDDRPGKAEGVHFSSFDVDRGTVALVFAETEVDLKAGKFSQYIGDVIAYNITEK